MARTTTRRKAKPAPRRPAAASPSPAPAARLVAEAPAPVEEALYTVVDELAKVKPRTHEVWVTRRRGDGRRERVPVGFTMHPGEPLKIPKEAAIQFAKIPEFTVRTPSGAKIKPPSEKAGSDGKVKLLPGQVVANVDELTDDALLKRARLLPGGERLPRTPKRADLVDFVMAGGEDVDDFVEDSLEIEDEDDPDDIPARPAARQSTVRHPAPMTTAAEIERALHAGVDSIAAGADSATEVDDADLDDDELPDDEG